MGGGVGSSPGAFLALMNQMRMNTMKIDYGTNDGTGDRASWQSSIFFGRELEPEFTERSWYIERLKEDKWKYQYLNYIPADGRLCLK